MFDNYSSDETRRRAEELKSLLGSKNTRRDKSEYDNRSWFNMPQGTEKVTLRILPIFPPLAESGYMMRYGHNFLPGEKKKFLCLQTNGMNCPICEVVNNFKMKFQGADEMQQTVRNLEATCKVYVNGLYIRATDDKGNLIALTDMNKKPYETKKLYLTSLSMSVFQWLVDSLADREKGDVLHPINGRNITLQREKFNGAFKLREFSFQSTPIGDTEQEVSTLMSGMYKMTDIWKTPDDQFYKEAKEIASLLDATLDQKYKELMGGIGSMTPIHPKAMAPNPAQMMGNPAFAPQVAAPIQSAPSGWPPKDDIPNFSSKPAPAAFSQGTPVWLSPTAPSAPVQSTPAPTPPIGFIPPQQMQGGATTGVAAAMAMAPTKSTAPPGAPQCFSDPTVFNRSSSKCMVCNYDYHCEKAIQAKQHA